jgi:hypothetical protein
MAPKGHKAPKVDRVRKETLDHKVFKDLRARKATRATRV